MQALTMTVFCFAFCFAFFFPFFFFTQKEIDLKMDAVKGIGKDHAKFSPVGTFIPQSIASVRFANEDFEQRWSQLHLITGTQSCNRSELKPRRRQERQIFAYLTMKEGVLRALHVHFSFAVHSAAFLVLFTTWSLFDWLNVKKRKKNYTCAVRAAHTSGTKQQLIIGVPQLRFLQQLEQAKVTFF